MLDSGVDIVRGIELAGSVNLVPAEQEITPMYVDFTGHGTAIASIIAGSAQGGTLGVNPNVDLYSVKVLDEHNAAPLSRIIEGIYWCIDNNINIINMSFGTAAYSQALQNAAADAYDAGILMVGAAGNQAGAVEYPAAFAQVMAVAATNTQAEIADFSSVGDELDIAAPGEKIKAAGFFGGSIVTHGTSIAVPHVVGVASLLWEQDVSKSNEFIRQLIACSGKAIENSSFCGLLDAAFALEIYDTFAANFNGTQLAPNHTVPENTEETESFPQIDDDAHYVEGRWDADEHKEVVDLADDATNIFTTTEIAIIKRGCTYPDRKTGQLISGVAGFVEYPEWHGYFRNEQDRVHVNFIACYDFLMKLAKKGGDTSTFTSATSVKGISSDSFNKMKGCFTMSSGVPYQFGSSSSRRTYVQILDDWSYSTQTAAKQKRYRQLFIYGLAMHVGADAFAHSSYARKYEVVSGQPKISYVYISHNENTWPGHADVDNIVVTNDLITNRKIRRYDCAKLLSEFTVVDAGNLIDYDHFFSNFWLAIVNGESGDGIHTFYIGNITNFAEASFAYFNSWNDFVDDFNFVHVNKPPYV